MGSSTGSFRPQRSPYFPVVCSIGNCLDLEGKGVRGRACVKVVGPCDARDVAGGCVAAFAFTLCFRSTVQRMSLNFCSYAAPKATRSGMECHNAFVRGVVNPEDIFSGVFVSQGEILPATPERDGGLFRNVRADLERESRDPIPEADLRLYFEFFGLVGKVLASAELLYNLFPVCLLLFIDVELLLKLCCTSMLLGVVKELVALPGLCHSDNRDRGKSVASGLMTEAPFLVQTTSQASFLGNLLDPSVP